MMLGKPPTVSLAGKSREFIMHRLKASSKQCNLNLQIK